MLANQAKMRNQRSLDLLSPEPGFSTGGSHKADTPVNILTPKPRRTAVLKGSAALKAAAAAAPTTTADATAEEAAMSKHERTNLKNSRARAVAGEPDKDSGKRSKSTAELAPEEKSAKLSRHASAGFNQVLCL